MCGIVAFIGTFSGFEVAYNGIKILQNRGYDSCGVCSFGKRGNLVVHKYASRSDRSGVELIGDHQKEHQDSKILTLHTRWATSGAISDSNAHPHLDNKGRVSVVHNGIIENYQELKDFLLQKGYTFSSETDTEVIAVLIGFYLDAKYKFMAALEAAISKLQGTWGLAVLSTETPNTLYLCKKGSPLLVGYEKNFALIASESSAVLNHVKSYFTIADNEIITIGLKPKAKEICITHNAKIIKNPCQYFNCCSTQEEIQEFKKNNNLMGEGVGATGDIGSQLIALTPDPYPHWMLKEIMEQPDSLLRTINLGGRLLNEYQVHLGGLRNNREDLMNVKHLLILGCGTSYHAALLGAKYFKILQSVESVQVIDASEFSVKDIPRPYHDVGILVLSQSGETKDVHRSMEIAKDEGIFTFSIVNVVGSLIAREAACGIYLNAGREVAVASTKSFSSQALALSLIAIWFSEAKEHTKQRRREFIKCIRNLSMDCRDVLKGLEKQCDSLVPILKDQQSIFILGRDLGEPIAYEGALKIKEIAYLHAEGYPGGSLKHGPFALIKKGTPIILLMFDDECATKMEIAADEVKTRGAYNVLITNRSLSKVNTKLFHHIIQVPDNKIFGSLLAVLPLQYLSYKIALELGHNPDYPRNLAKVVTVDG